MIVVTLRFLHNGSGCRLKLFEAVIAISYRALYELRLITLQVLLIYKITLR